MRTLDSLLFLNSTPLIGTTLGMNSPSWSISAEMISYILFGVGVLVTHQKPTRFFALVVVGSVIFCITQKEYLFTGDFGFVRGWIGFLAGYLVYKLKDAPFTVSKHLEWLLLPALLVIFYLINRNASDRH